MNSIQKRFLLFTLCIITRFGIAFLAKRIDSKYLPYIGYLNLFIGSGFIYLWLTGKRKIGLETGGEPIWWNNLRPVHGLLAYLFAYYAINKSPQSWKFLTIDTIIGLIAFLIYHFSEGNLYKLL